jgi:ribonuclease/clavin/mitogillin
VLESAFREIAKSTNTSEPDVSDIIISHWHHDHVCGLPTVLSSLRRLWEERNPSLLYKPPRLHKFPLPSNAQDEDTSSHNKIPSLVNSLPKDSYTPSPDGSPFHDLSDDQILTAESSPTSTLRVLHTPGHTTDSICLHIPQDRALFTADTVLGQGTAVFEDLSTYLASLNKMLQFGSDSKSPYVSLYPGHGPVVTNGRELIATYIKHRLDREAQVVQVLQSPVPSGQTNWTTWLIVKILYSAYLESLWLPAAHGINLHLKKLEGDGVVRCLGGEGTEMSWKLTSRRSSPSL